MIARRASPTGPRHAPREDRAISRALVAGFATIALIAAILSATLLVMVARASEALEAVREDARSAQAALEIALEAREHYKHEAHATIQAGAGDMRSHNEWVDRVQRRARALARRVPPGEQWHLERLARTVLELDAVFREQVVPAATTADRDRLERAHARATQLMGRVTSDADAVVRSLELRMARGQQRARRAADLAVAAGVGGILLIVLLAAAFAVGLRRAILLPLQRLSEAARRIGRGENPMAAEVNGRGEIATVAHALEDMTDLLRQRERQLVESERMAVIGQLSAGVAHEINNPIAVIRGYLRTMIPEASEEELRGELEILDEEASACQHIVEDLLSFARAPQLQRTSTAVTPLLESAAERFTATEVGREHPVDVRVEPSELNVDVVRMRQVLDNLLRNAAQSSPSGAPLGLRGEATGHGYRIEIVDRGEGIAEADRERIFEPFCSSRASGTGLGLAVCKAIVEAHGGTVHAAPGEDGGARMVVDLPESYPAGSPP